MPADVASWLELDAGAFAHDVAVFRRLIGGARLGGVLKGNAYGHGFAPCLEVLHPLTDVLYVITPEDGLAIRAWEAARGAARRQVVVIGALSPDEAVALARADVEAVVGDAAWGPVVQRLRAAGAPPLRVQVHVDSGLGREGFRPEELVRALSWLGAARDVLVVGGALTHFADTEDVTEQTYARHQLARFADGVRALETLVPGVALERHAAASAAAMILPESRLDVVRVGIALYGLWPSRETRISARVVLGEAPTLAPVLSWRCPSQLVKALPEGSFVGYGCTWRCPRPTTVAVLPVGYFDGYPRLVSGKAHVLVRGHRCAVLGRVMMNHVIVDVTGVARPGEQVVATLLGRDGDEEIPAERLAEWSQTIHYEVVARLGAHLERRVVRPG